VALCESNDFNMNISVVFGQFYFSCRHSFKNLLT